MLTSNYYRPTGWSETPRIWDVSRVYTDPVTEPVTLAQMKAWLRMDYDEEDALITDLITVGRSAVERYCNISIVPVSLTVTADWNGEWELPYGPVIDDVTVTGGTDMRVRGTLFKALSYCGEQVVITYEAGYSVAPPDLVNDIKRVVAWLYEHRGDDQDVGLNETLKLFCKKHKRMQWL